MLWLCCIKCKIGYFLGLELLKVDIGINFIFLVFLGIKNWIFYGIVIVN